MYLHGYMRWLNMSGKSIRGEHMSEENKRKGVNIGQVDPQKREQSSIKKGKHVPSKIHPDTLFTFTTKLEYLIKSLEHRMISPRYCREDIRYLKVNEVKWIAYPMKCFCDINMQKLDVHMEWYGEYGIAFYKDWGMKHNIQPLHYLNENSDLLDDISKVFKRVLREKGEDPNTTYTMLKNYLLHELMYYKPYQGRIQNRRTGKLAKKCFTDECEWRYIADVSKLNLPQVIPESNKYDANLERLYNDAMDLKKEVSLCFEYSDIKHIIIPSLAEYKELSRVVDSWGLKDDKEEILSKVIVWQQQKEDF